MSDKKKFPSGLAFPVVPRNPDPLEEVVVTVDPGEYTHDAHQPSRLTNTSVMRAQYDPVPVVLTSQTFIRLLSWIAIPLLGVISASLFFYWKTQVHMDNQEIHMVTGERAGFESKIEAKQSREKIVKEIKQHQEVKIRELRVEQKEQIQDLGTQLQRAQRREIRSVIQEIRKGRDH